MTLKFKTNINCGNCIKAVTPTLSAEEGIKSWKVDTENPDKILTVETDTLSIGELVELVEEAGFEASPIVSA
ncbi:MAG: heavy-metal-associated domain-containing protein [Chitinophagaceae bacterium]